MWEGFCVGRFLCGMVFVWECFCVGRFLCGKVFVWEGFCVGRCLCGNVFVWEGFCVGCFLLRGKFFCSGENYPPNADCSWIIAPDGADYVELQFLELSTESCCDFVTIYGCETADCSVTVGSSH